MNKLLFFLLLIAVEAGAAFRPVNSGGTGSTTNVLVNGPWQYWDDFNKPLVTDGQFPPAPSGHIYHFTTSTGYSGTNGVRIENGRWFFVTPGQYSYLSVSNEFAVPFGSKMRWNKFMGVVRFERGYLPDGSTAVADGVERNVVMILTSHAQVSSSPLFLHCTFGPRLVHIQRELSSTNYINELLPDSTYLRYNTNYTFTLTLVSNTVSVEYAGYKFQRTDPTIGLYTTNQVVIWETGGEPTNQFYGKFEACAAGYTDPVESAVLGLGGIVPGSTNFYIAGFKLEEGTANARSGTATLSSGLATVNTTAVNANSRFRTAVIASAGPVNSVCVTNIVNNTSFQIRSLSNTDGNRVDWEIVEKVP